MPSIEISKDFRLLINVPKFQRGLTLLIGKNGSGKTTLLRILSKKIKIANQEFCELIREIEHTGFNPFIEETTIPSGETLNKIVKYFTFTSSLDRSLFEKMANKLNINHILNQPFKKCSTGEKKKFLLLLNLCQTKGSIYFLDEPIENIDNESKCAIIELLNSFASEKLIFITTHHPNEFKGDLIHKHQIHRD
tara:strand:- start:3929 stop:4507 length:579 start_codon:yes stop_codon:yes gene_type:complete